MSVIARSRALSAVEWCCHAGTAAAATAIATLAAAAHTLAEAIAMPPITGIRQTSLAIDTREL